MTQSKDPYSLQYFNCSRKAFSPQSALGPGTASCEFPNKLTALPANTESLDSIATSDEADTPLTMTVFAVCRVIYPCPSAGLVISARYVVRGRVFRSPSRL